MAKIVDDAFWHSKWEQNQLGFHQEKVNSRLVKYWPLLNAPAHGKAFVPLCGKSLDMCWLAEQQPVLGNELSDIAVRDFFSENTLTPHVTTDGDFSLYRANNIEVLCGDFFDLTQDHLKNVVSVFDRAALIALPADLRARYADHLGDILVSGASVLLISMQYDESKMNGPPFSVPENEVNILFQDNFSVEKIAESSGPDILGNLKERGLDTLTEEVFILIRK